MLSRSLAVKVGLGLAASVVVLLAYAVFFTQSGPRNGTAILIELFRERRPIEFRLSGGFHAGEVRDRSRFRDLETDPRLSQARTLILGAADSRRDHDSYLAYGQLQVLMESASAGIPQFRRAIELHPGSAEAHNDLGVALAESGRLEEAISNFDLALEFNPHLREALLNRALCYRRMQLPTASERDFEAAGGLETDRGWKDEITAHIRLLREPPVDRSIEEILGALNEALSRDDETAASRVVADNLPKFRGHVITKLTRQYLLESTSGNVAEASRSLRSIEQIGKLVRENNGDNLLADIALYLEGLSPRQMRTEFKLIEEYLRAMALYESNQHQEARSAYVQLEQSFRQQGNEIFETRASNMLVATEHYFRSFSSMVERLETMEKTQRQRGWINDLALTLAQLGYYNSLLGRDSLALHHLKESIDIHESIGEPAPKPLQFLGLTFWSFGDLERALEPLLESTMLYAEKRPNKIELANNYLLMADVYRLRGNHTLSVLYAEESLRLVGDSGYPFREQALSLLALQRAKLGQTLESVEQITEALESISKQTNQTNFFTESLVHTRAGELALSANNHGLAVEHFTMAVEYSTLGPHPDTPLEIAALRGRAQSYLASARVGLARADLERAIRLVEDYRQNITQSDYRSYFLGASQEVFDEMIKLEIQIEGNWDLALELSERSRARSLLDEISTHHPDRADSPRGAPLRPRTLLEIQEHLPPDMLLAEYSVVRDQAFIFAVTRESLHGYRVDVGADELSRLTNDYLERLGEGADPDLPEINPGINESARTLYDYLLAPIEHHLAGAKRICLVPDKSLHFLPFVALRDRQDRYVVESHTLSYAPSASVLLECIDGGVRRPRRDSETILAVGDPAFDREKFPLLRRLPDAQIEAMQCGALYSEGSVVLQGLEATKPRVMSKMTEVSVIHLATHTLVDGSSPWLAVLVLGADRESDEPGADSDSAPLDTTTGLSFDHSLRFTEIYDIGLRNTRLVVLSSCQSALGRYYRGEGIVSLVRPFIATGIPEVVASLWSVASPTTSQLMMEFHRSRTMDRLPSDEALRAAQLKLLRSSTGSHPFAWAPFVLVGVSD